MRKLLFLSIIAASVAFTACTGSTKSNQKNANVEASAETPSEKHALLSVGGSCDMCTDRIIKTVNEIDGVTLSDYNLENQELHIHYIDSKTSIEAVSKALATVGHDTELFKADQEVYDALPGCCKYREA